MSDARRCYDMLLEAAGDLILEHVPAAFAFTKGPLPANPDFFLAPTVASLPIAARIGNYSDRTPWMMRPLIGAIIDANTYLKWQQSYTEKDGFDAHYLANYGWFNLMSPDGPYRSDDLRISFGYWESGLVYKTHWHEPEEIYIPLSGKALFHSEGRPSRLCGPGDTVVHKSNQPHSIEITPGPLLAMAIWRGENLNRKSDLPDHNQA